MTLHKAIEKVLIEFNRSMTTQEIAKELNKNGSYQKRDKSIIEPFQIHGRTRKYPHLFERNGSSVLLISNENSPKRKTTHENQMIQKLAKKTVLSYKIDIDTIEKKLMEETHFKSASLIDDVVPNEPGLYCIRINKVKNIPSPFNDELTNRKHDIIYIGIASKNLNKRFLKQELRAKGHGTFFRSIGAVLGFIPPKGSLLDKKNKRNYKFSATDELKIIQWINNNLTVNWVSHSDDFENIELTLIQKYKPLLNIAKNPASLGILSDLRADCVRVANEN